jgi:nucleotide-binding universal stress UspA family protein
MVKRILCPIDFSDAGCHAAEYTAKELAPQLHAEIVWLSVLEPTDIRVALDAGLYGFENDDSLHRQVEEWIDQQFARIDPGGGVPTRRDIRRGIPEREILDAIREHTPDLIVMGSTGIAKRLPIGRKAEYVLRHSDVPVLLVKG